jgi:superfamily II DNA/RNA helicase
VDDVELVIHVDPPTEHKAYLHRSGRTARAGSDGTVVTLTLPEQQSDVKKLMKAAGVEVNFERVTANSPLVAELVGEMADKIDPRTRAALLAAKAKQQGGGTSTGANAERKRARRTTQAAPTAGGRGGRGGRGKVSAEAPRTDLPRAERRAVAYEGRTEARAAADRVVEQNEDRAIAAAAARRNARGRGSAASTHRNDVPAAGGRASAGRGSDGRSDSRVTRSDAPRGGTGRPASSGGQRGGRPATGQRAAAGAGAGGRSGGGQRSAGAGAASGGNKAVWSSNTGGTSGGSYAGNGGGGRSGDGRPARSGPRRASAPASNERRSR